MRERERERSGEVVKDTTFRVRKKKSIYEVWNTGIELSWQLQKNGQKGIRP
jgi:hypothetical protein